MIKIAPSILAADPINLERDVHRAEEAGCDWLHIDVMDAHFVPNLAYSPEVVRRLKAVCRTPLDVHLMLDHPEQMLDTFLEAGADVLTVHAEIDANVPEILKRIRHSGALAGVALKPGTPFEAIRDYLEKADLILAMTVEPGFGGQKLDGRVPEKIAQIQKSGYNGLIEADGGIYENNLPMLVEKGLTVAVMGTAIFGATDMRETIERLHRI